MRVSTDDTKFGFVISQVRGDMFRFQMLVGGRLVGDADPCILGSAMHRLGGLPHLDDDRLRHLTSDVDSVLLALETDEVLHDAATLSVAESLDQWLIYGYEYGRQAVFLAQENTDGKPAGSVSVSVLDVTEYYTVLDAVRGYWEKARVTPSPVG